MNHDIVAVGWIRCERRRDQRSLEIDLKNPDQAVAVNSSGLSCTSALEERFDSRLARPFFHGRFTPACFSPLPYFHTQSTVSGPVSLLFF